MIITLFKLAQKKGFGLAARVVGLLLISIPTALCSIVVARWIGLGWFESALCVFAIAMTPLVVLAMPIGALFGAIYLIEADFDINAAAKRTPQTELINIKTEAHKLELLESGKTIEFSSPDGFCYINQTAYPDYFSSMQKSYADHDFLLGIMLPCNQLPNRKNQELDLTLTTILVKILNDGRENGEPKKWSKSQYNNYIAETAKTKVDSPTVLKDGAIAYVADVEYAKKAQEITLSKLFVPSGINGFAFSQVSLLKRVADYPIALELISPTASIMRVDGYLMLTNARILRLKMQGMSDESLLKKASFKTKIHDRAKRRLTYELAHTFEANKKTLKEMSINILSK